MNAPTITPQEAEKQMETAGENLEAAKNALEKAAADPRFDTQEFRMMRLGLDGSKEAFENMAAEARKQRETDSSS